MAPRHCSAKGFDVFCGGKGFRTADTQLDCATPLGVVARKELHLLPLQSQKLREAGVRAGLTNPVTETTPCGFKLEGLPLAAALALFES